jgi:hypothetical protein
MGDHCWAACHGVGRAAWQTQGSQQLTLATVISLLETSWKDTCRHGADGPAEGNPVAFSDDRTLSGRFCPVLLRHFAPSRKDYRSACPKLRNDFRERSQSRCWGCEAKVSGRGCITTAGCHSALISNRRINGRIVGAAHMSESRGYRPRVQGSGYYRHGEPVCNVECLKHSPKPPTQHLVERCARQIGRASGYGNDHMEVVGCFRTHWNVTVSSDLS